MSEAKGCATCRWAKFEATPTGRIKRGVAGRCEWLAPPPPPFPMAMRLDWPARIVGGIWPDMANCPTWEPKKAEGGRS